MKQTLISQRQQRGLTLVELMIGLLVGMLVIGAVLYVFLGSRLTYKYNDTMGRIQENGRVAIEMIGQDVRMAGFIGCRRLAAYLPPPSATGSISAESIYFSDDFTNAIKTNLGLSELNLADKGFVFSHEIDDQVEGTDSLAVLAGSTEVPLAELMADGAAAIVTSETVPAGPAIVSDCRFDRLSLSDTAPSGVPASAEAFLVSTEGKTIAHAGYAFQRAYDTDASITPISAVSYSIRETGRTDSDGNAVRSLFRNGDELIEGARDLCVRYGVAENSSNEAVAEYVEADDVGDWKQVIAIRIELLLASVDDNSVDTAAAVPTLCDRPVPDEDDRVFDRRMYKVFSTTVGLRNQVRQP